MNSEFKTKNIKKLTQKLEIFDKEIIDLSDMNLFEAANTIISLSTYSLTKNQKQKIKFKVSTPQIQNIIKEIPLNKTIEIV